MHSRIFQLSTTAFDLTSPRDERDDHSITADHFTMDWEGVSPIYKVADYVDDIAEKDVEDNIQWLLNAFHSDYYEYDAKERSIVFKDGFHKEYFKDKLEQFLKQAKQIEENNELFYKGYQAYVLSSVICDRHAFYIYTDDLYEVPLDEFVREHLRTGEKYHFGSVIDYHF